jgi:tetratricopeptide (TPR) repeat protein
MQMSFRSAAAIAMLVLVALGGAPPASAAGTMVDQVLISRQGDSATLEIHFACRNRYIDSFPLTRSERVQINLFRVDECGLSPIATPRREMQRPIGREMAALKELEFIRSGDGNEILLLNFDAPVSIVAQQRGDLSRLVITVDMKGVPASPAESWSPAIPMAVLPDQDKSARNPEQVARAEARAGSQASQKTVQPAAGEGRYAINLESALQPVNARRLTAGQVPGDVQMYATEVIVDGQTWYRLRLGFFAAETEAETALENLRSEYPKGWVVRVGEEERHLAASNPVVAAGETQTPASSAAAASAVSLQAQAAGLSAIQISQLMDDGRQAIRAGDNDRAVQIYTKVLREPENENTRQAQEYLGLARERNGQNAHAVAEYRRYLMLYPDGEDAARVRQRLAGLTAVNEMREAPFITDTGADDRKRWDSYGGIAQYYRRDVSQFGDQDTVVGQSSLLTDFDFVTRRRGDRIDFSSRATMGNLYDLLSEEDGPGSSTRIYQLYVDVVDSQWDLSGRFGRQSMPGSGVLGRFDGAQLGWSFRPDARLNFVTGYPVDSTGDGVNTDRFFYGMSTDFSNLFERLDVSLFFNIQEVDGVQDRQAVGSELRYFDDSRSLIMLVDYDVSYSEMNSFVTLGNWAFPNRLTLNAMIDFRKSPLLTTRNALIGQSVSSIEELLVLFGEDEIRQLAKDRTGDLQTYSLGLSAPLFDRFQLNADATMTNYDGTLASGGVPAIPDVDGTIYYTLTAVGSSLLMEQDTTIFGLGYVDGDSASTTTLTVDSRYPVTRSMRINPRLRVSQRDIERTDSSQWIAAPSLRMLYRFARRYEVELELGGEWSKQQTATDSIDYNSYFIYAGYRADF